MDAISCLPPPMSSSYSYSYADAAAIARALHFSTDSTDLPSSYYVPPPHAATCCDSVLVADSPPRRRRSSPAGARAGKRRSRASKRAPTTYISTDAANFRLMVQHITGVQADAATGVETMAMLRHVQQALDAAGSANPQLLPAGDDASAVRQLQHQQPCFPTLDSWNVSNVMYETNSAEML